jgi:glycosyltransferase involved in cell wall biosynthesis
MEESDMRVALLSQNAQHHDAIGQQVAEKLAFFRDRAAEVRVFVENSDQLHPDVRPFHHVIQGDDNSCLQFLATSDLVVVEFGQYYPSLNLLPLLAGGRPRLVIDYHGVTPVELWSGHNREAVEKGQRYRGLVWCVDFAVAHSRFTCDELVRGCQFPSPRTVQLGLPIDDAFTPGTPTRNWRKELGLEKATILLYVGRLAPNKNLQILIEALDKLRQRTPPVHALLVGKTNDLYQSEMRSCLARAADLGIGDRLHVLGALPAEELRDAYRSADVFVTPSRWEGFGIPVVEAMACGTPVIAARAGALPETVAAAGLSFSPGDAGDLARQVCRVLDAAGQQATQPSRVAVVAFRFGADFPGGAETSLRTIARTLQDAGHAVEVFTTCTSAEHAWRNDLPEGSIKIDGLTVHRFAIDPHDRDRHVEAVGAIMQATEPVAESVEQEYLRGSVHSTRLLEALERRKDEFAAIIAGPYLFGLTHDVACAFPEKTLLVPCFHDEPMLRMQSWRKTYANVGGILYHSPEEKELSINTLGLNHPRSYCLGTTLDLSRAGSPAEGARLAGTDRYLVYCGRYSAQKRVPELLEFARRYLEEHPERFHFVFVGHGEVTIPRASWLRDLGFLSEDDKRHVLAGAAALIQLSRYESLSLVALESWTQGTPVLGDAGCPVLVGHLERSSGGQALADYDDFAKALDSLWNDPAAWQEKGRHGRDYVRQRYGSPQVFRDCLEQALMDLRTPLGELMRRRGLERAKLFRRAAWREQFGRLVERWLEEAPRPHRVHVEVQALAATCVAAAGMRRWLTPVRVVNRGTHALLAEGPGRTLLRCRVMYADGGCDFGEETTLAGLLRPGETQAASVVVPVPPEPGDYKVILWAESASPSSAVAGAANSENEIDLTVEAANARVDRPACAVLLDSVQAALAEAHQRQCLPDDYVDITEGWFASWKKRAKRKLLGNFKHAYVDVLSRQQSQVNRELITAVQQLAECCATLDHAVRSLQERLARLESTIQEATVASGVR